MLEREFGNLPPSEVDDLGEGNGKNLGGNWAALLMEPSGLHRSASFLDSLSPCSLGPEIECLDDGQMSGGRTRVEAFCRSLTLPPS